MDELEDRLCEALLGGQDMIYLISFTPDAECEKIERFIKKRFGNFRMMTNTIGFKNSDSSSIRLKHRGTQRTVYIEVFRIGSRCYLEKEEKF